MRWFIVVAALTLGACGGDDDGGVIDSGVHDAAGGSSDGGAAADAAAGGTQEVNQFCELTDEGPYCVSGLECCTDKVCRHTGDCPGSDQFITCDCTADCQNGICCDVPGMDTFCTKRSACNDYDGVEDTTCP